MAASNPTTLYDHIQGNYNLCPDSSIDSALRQHIAVSLGLGCDPQDASAISEQASIGASCSDLLQIATLSKDEKVVIVGCGEGTDVTRAAQAVGPTGRAIAVDATEANIDIAKRNAELAGTPYIELVQSELGNIPLETNSIDCVVASCVQSYPIGEDKKSIIREVHRVLRPCGRLAMSDVLVSSTSAEVPDSLESRPIATMEVVQMENFLVEIGFDDVLLVDTGSGPATSGAIPSRQLNESSLFLIFGHKSCGKNKGPKQVRRLAGTSTSCCAGGGCC